MLKERKWLGNLTSQLIKLRLTGNCSDKTLVRFLITEGYVLTTNELIVAKKIELLMLYGMDYENPFDWPLDKFLTEKPITFPRFLRKSLNS